MDVRELFILNPPLEQNNKRRWVYLLLCILFAGIGWFLSFTYRPYVYAHHINDFHLADTIGNIVAVPATAFLFYALQKTIRHTKFAVLTLVFLIWCLYESVFSLTFDWWDILASLLMSFVIYPLLLFLEKYLPK